MFGHVILSVVCMFGAESMAWVLWFRCILNFLSKKQEAKQAKQGSKKAKQARREELGKQNKEVRTQNKLGGRSSASKARK